MTVLGDGRTGGTLRAAMRVETGHPGSLQLRLVDPATHDKHTGRSACRRLRRAHMRGNRRPSRHDRRRELVNEAERDGRLRGLIGVTPLLRERAWIVETARNLYRLEGH